MNKPYRWLAEYYDDFFGESRAPMDLAREQILGRILPRVESACDLACGTGTAALVMARRGIKTFAVDGAPMMCRVAREKARLAGLTVKVIRADMRDFRLPEPVDLITCEFDAINHVPSKAGLVQVAAAAQRALKPGGYFYFDVNNSRGFRQYWSGTTWLEKPGVVLVLRSSHNKEADQAWADVDWFIREAAGKWRRHRERVEEVCWDAGEIERALRAAGFERIRKWDAAPFFKRVSDARQPDGRGLPLVTRGCRSIYLARKSGA